MRDSTGENVSLKSCAFSSALIAFCPVAGCLSSGVMIWRLVFPVSCPLGDLPEGFRDSAAAFSTLFAVVRVDGHFEVMVS